MGEHASHHLHPADVLRHLGHTVLDVLHDCAAAEEVYVELVQDFDRGSVDLTDPDRVRWTATPSGWQLRGNHLAGGDAPERPHGHEAA